MLNKERVSIFSPTQEHDLLRRTVRRFAQERLSVGALERDVKEYFDVNLFRELGHIGLLGITAPESFGGSQMDASAAVLVHEELSAVDPGFCLAYLAHSMLCVNNIAINASDEQKKRYLPKLCSGEWIGAMAMSEPEVGTDVLGIGCRAERCESSFIINGRKMWITNGVIDNSSNKPDVLFLYAKTSESCAKKNISSFIIDGAQEGYKVGQHLKHKLGMRASNTAELVFEDCVVPAEQLVGQEGDSLVHLMRNLEVERLTLAAMSLGIARRCLEIMNNYAKEREAFGVPINKFGQIQKYIAESYAKYKACRAYVYNVAYHADLSQAHGRIDSDGVKLVTSTVAKEIADAAIQVLGGYGYMGEYVVERLWRDAKLLEIGGGTLEAHQKNMCSDLAKKPSMIFE
ncbi:MAG: acyl-CoA dehydrogenase family protein [Myxococcales bacterium]|nr:acyl-CoA dehydrogenase family protein [Myxococcales bacterium]USN50011.1 MAG: acyl-CoA dehydrogenase family protein [Myxococcales bacterium]